MNQRHNRTLNLQTAQIHAFLAAIVLAHSAWRIPANADVIYWVGYQNGCMINRPENASFLHGDNWLNFVVPGEFDNAIYGAEEDSGANPGWPHVVHFGDFCVDVFACPNPFTVPGADVVIQSLEIQDDVFVFDMSPGETPLGDCPSDPIDRGSLTATDTVTIGCIITDTTGASTGHAGDAELTLQSGTFAANIVNIGLSTDSIGAVIVTGGDSVFSIEDWMHVGRSGVGLLEINDGGHVSSISSNGWCGLGVWPEGSGAMLVSGVESLFESRWLIIGTPGTGAVTVTNGGKIQIAMDGWCTLGEDCTEWDPIPDWCENDESGDAFGRLLVSQGGIFESPGINIGNDDFGTMDIQSGGQVTCDRGVNIGLNVSSVGILTISGGNSNLRATEWMNVGNNGDGTLSIRAGGSVSSSWCVLGLESTGTGSISISNGGIFTLFDDNDGHALFTIGYDGSGSVDVSGLAAFAEVEGQIQIGRNGNGLLTVSGGGQVYLTGEHATAGGLGIVGVKSQATGQLVITGTDSYLNTSGQIQIGVLGNGAMTISDGGIVETHKKNSPTDSSGIVGLQLGGTGTASINGEGSMWTQDGVLVVGFWGQGVLVIENGGIVSSIGAKLGMFAGSTGDATVSGAGSIWNNTEDLCLSDAGSGTLTILDGGIVIVKNDVIAHGVIPCLTVSEGELWVGGDLSHQITNEQCHATSGGILNMNGTGIQHLEVAGDDLGLPSDTIADNFNWGAMVVGQESQPTTVILQDRHDNGNRGGNGEPEVFYLSGFPQGDDGLSILGGSTLILNDLQAYVGTLDGWVHLNALFGPNDFKIPYDEGFLQLSLCAGDFNNDGIVDTRDFVAFLAAWAGGDPTADFNGDGVIDTRDFVAFLGEWAAGC